MNSLLVFELPISEAVVERLGWALIHSLWQLTLVALVAGAIFRALRRRSAATRYVVLVAAMGIAVIAPMATWVLLPGGGQDASRSATASRFDSKIEQATNRPADAGPVAGNQAVAGDSSIAKSNPDFAASPAEAEMPPATSPPAPADNDAMLSWLERAAAILRPWLAWIVTGWSIGVAVCSLRPLLGWHTLRRLQRVGISPVPDEVLGRRAVSRHGWGCATRCGCCNRRSRRCRSSSVTSAP